MKILHYFPGFERSGGLNRYAGDLAVSESRAGHEVHVLYPVYGLRTAETISISGSRRKNGVFLHRLYGALPLPLLEGVRDPEMMMREKPVDENMLRFITDGKFDVLHIHTFMGLNKTLLELFKRSSCRIVFTSHDYYPFCSRVNLIDLSGKLCENCSNEKCSLCNAAAPGERYLALRNSWIIKFKKVLKPLAALRKNSSVPQVSSVGNVKDFNALRAYYIDMLKMCDIIHFNSDVACGVYEKFVSDLPGKVIPITHSGIVDRRQGVVNAGKIRFGFVGSSAPYKGLPELLAAADELHNSGCRNFSVEVFGCSSCGKHLCDVNYHGVFDPADADRVYRRMDILVVPSVWYETFGFIVSEALSRGVGVIASDMVGAKVLIDESLIYHTRNELIGILKRVLTSPCETEEISRKICASPALESMEEHSRKIVDLYNSI